ncbi:MAG: tRNA (adenosine(37)-N6)-threonylcarbamoyltransferase complex ATPase subunit type 1 TsaE [Ardenticatenia bacterium]|uniref:tRNA threonylcarbamoyladenosine biosynthesis protein TsaE n=1 Tax=Ardenticatena maritima TaxID=872965 RepID=A0A0M8K8M6_9CHLR|nr:tRNA (adenosine(37)-N6)-threonylcarbamoyltransferase complex ATPase subunit type 1 TsaE [Ardenticatena maritima]KPL87277.1 hypothetical protein SE16_12345 [Ardenticatena maritima]RME09405.1 MAG: tRNA (adenosine(37)-N6)-threonylcarbamoyltransferase complex ATPase subunit type 1 TsaE [Ardenticatenia bacterium]GAP62719.1 tRNA threonylcarbamoyladenosine biosynthesis protein TsaE [Ardenticatena maritima]
MPVIEPNTLDFFSHSPEQTRRLGARLAQLLEPGDIILLTGTLGAGKTHFVQGLARGLGVQRPVRSPTFTLVSEYPEGRIPLYHADLYRLNSEAELETVGLEEYMERGDGVVAVEWAEKAADWFPEGMWIRFEHADDAKRRVIMKPVGERALRLLHAFRQAAFGR